MASRFIYFDLGNVLVTFDHRVAAKQLAQAAGCPLDLVFNTVFVSDLQLRYETGLVSDDDYAHEINQCLGSRLATETVLEAVSDIFQPNWPILDVLQRVQQAQVPMGILSNTCDAHWRWLMKKDWPMLHGWFEHQVLSYEVGCMKPHGGIYDACEHLCGAEGSQIFFTDDRLENVTAAAERGWKTCLFRDVTVLQTAIDGWLEAT